jgi:hypothetical protein
MKGVFGFPFLPVSVYLSFMTYLSEEQIGKTWHRLKVKASHFCEVTACNLLKGRVYDEGGRQTEMETLKRWHLFTKLNGVWQNAVIFIDTAMRN